MTRTILDCAPRSLWKHFYSLTRIPRPSHHEAQVQAFIQAFGEGLGLETLMDENGNVIIRKPATEGMEARPGVILQGHLDMVPQANADSRHDFTKDPIELRFDGDWLTASETTLGADNGIGVAAAMAILESNQIAHGPIEGLFTSNEEDGMVGAFGLKPGLLQGKVLINMDSEDEGVLFIGCAGGIDATSRLPYVAESVVGDVRAFRLSLTGLKGGHSGVDIHRGRGNANKLLFRLLRQGMLDYGLRLCSINGGSLRNAIPREAFASITLPQEQIENFNAYLVDQQKIISRELAHADAGATVTMDAMETPSTWLGQRVEARLINAICAAPHGVVRMSDDMPGLVETSTNLAIVRSEEGVIEVQSLIRSSVNSARDDLCANIDALFSLAAAETDFGGAYPGWKPNRSSPVLSVMQQAYQELFGSEVKVSAIHAGLECGILGGNYPYLDMISFGPTIRFPHSPDERVEIPSVKKFWDLLTVVLGKV
ncbi:MAG: aminoacyl-histidine dipeptidase [Candidatus Sedimenticola sp. (ex Thyasira tokunagai)]